MRANFAYYINVETNLSEDDIHEAIEEMLNVGLTCMEMDGKISFSDIDCTTLDYRE